MKYILMTREQYEALTEPPTPEEWRQFEGWEAMPAVTMILQQRRERYERICHEPDSKVLR